MATVTPDGSISGAVGNGVFRNYNGKTILSSKPKRVRNPRSEAQQTQRLRIRNIINMYGPMKEALKNNFQGKTGCQSDYSRFQACNLSRPAVYLTYSESTSAIVAPYIVSFGTLAEIEYHLENDQLVTNIDVTGFDAESDVSVGTFSDILLNSPDLFKSGDRFELIACYQDKDKNRHTVHCDFCELRIDYTDLAPLNTVLNGFELSVNAEDKLCIRRQGACAMAIVRKRGEGRDASTSVQALAVNNPIYATYSSEAHKQLAIESYAKKKR